MLTEPSLLMPTADLPMDDCSEATPNEGLKVRPDPAALEESVRFSPAYNLFRNRLEPDLFCAVPEDRPVPTFIKAPNWTYVAKTDAVAQGAFDLETARTAVWFNEFYLFVALNRRGRRPRKVPSPASAQRSECC
ncbi:hypothetical protein [Microvirga aerophila]|uniref:Uncharacterized protein n=1 Tax=Microvirga aerophila TaxID=670291 RepID=A0A512C078_9HYPH|nr:hypothetical protein [Microvirga aerophila]GEO17616.1 hypothetical protein MAE02_53120 [Microvirga aerophila]